MTERAERERAADLILSGEVFLGIEFGSTRVKATLVAPDATVLAVGTSAWESDLVDGVWTYSLEAVWDTLADCYASLARSVQERYGASVQRVAALGVSGMMHGFLPTDTSGVPLSTFRTWRNNMTSEASSALTPLLSFAVPQRWTIAHLYQAILDDEPHVSRIASLNTLASYVHWRLTGLHVVGLNEASGMFPVDPTNQTWDLRRVAAFDDVIADRHLGWALLDILPRIAPAGTPAGTLTTDGAALIDRSGVLEAGIPLCPPEGDAGAGMVATNALRPRYGSVSAGTSIFGMIVLERPLRRIHEEIDIVTTPAGDPVAMAHSNNGSSDLDAWVSLLGDAGSVLGSKVDMDEVYATILPLAVHAEADAGGLLAYNYVSGEHITGFAEGRPLIARRPESRLTLPNLVRALYFASLCALRSGLDILRVDEGVEIDAIRGHGGLFKGGDTGQRMLAAALNAPVSVPATAGEGGSWGMAILASYLRRPDRDESLPDYVDRLCSGDMGTTINPDADDVAGFEAFYARHRHGMPIERAAVDTLR